jgi:hypothetical protein
MAENQKLEKRLLAISHRLYIDLKEVKEDKKGFDKNMKSLTATSGEQMEKASKLDKT